MKANEVLKILNISRQTLCKYHKKGLIKADILPSKQLKYNDEDVFKFLNKNLYRKNIIYSRVSTSSQKKDLENQEETLKQFCNKNGIKVDESYKDIGSGMNFERKDFQKLVNKIINYEVSKVFITYKDRLSRISFELFKNIFNNFKTEIIVLNDIDNEKLVEKEIFNEIISLIHSFSMKVYSNRRKEKLKLIEKDLKLEDETNI